MSQNSLIWNHLNDGGTLTPLQAFDLFGTLALHSRIAELRGRGHKIDCVMIDTPNGKRVGQYSMPKQMSLIAA